jgi:hypothetical protein
MRLGMQDNKFSGLAQAKTNLGNASRAHIVKVLRGGLLFILVINFSFTKIYKR